MRFLYNAPAILYRKALIIGDTHFGMESKLLAKGIFDQHFSDRLFEKIKSLLEQTKAEKLIILGDVKEKITSLDPKTADILAKLGLLAELIIVRGNHDGGIEGCGAKIISSKGFRFGALGPMERRNVPWTIEEPSSIGLVHGHGWPGKECMKADFLVSAHQHPMLSVTDTLGKRHTEPVWIIAEPDPDEIARHYTDFNPKIKLILMPAFNPLVGATFNAQDSRLGPILSNKLFKLNAAIIYRLDGTLFGEPKS